MPPQGLGMGGGGMREGSPNSYRKGWLKRRLPALQLYTLAPFVGSSAATATRITITGLSQNLYYLIGVSPVGPNQDPLYPRLTAGIAGNIPVNPGTMQITPFVDPPQGERQIYRPVFQDPTATDNKNNPLAMDIPFAWGISGDDADGAWVDVEIGDSAWVSESGVTGIITFQLVIAYDGNWWSTEALEKAIGQVSIRSDRSDAPAIVTQIIG